MENLTDVVRERYAEAARRVAHGSAATCGCGTGASSGERGPTASSAACCDPITSNLYGEADAAAVPESALRASLGCGNPSALAHLKPGEHVLDLGSGGGIDVILSAKRVGPDGKAYGLDMTDEMLALAEENKRKAGVTNVEFLKGHIEHVPLPDNTVDVIISNCVINLSADKNLVLREAFRVLKPNGRFAVSDVVVRGDLPPDIRRSMELWVGCVAGALTEAEYRRTLEAAGFTDVELEVTRTYSMDDARGFLAEAGIDVGAAASVSGKVVSAFIRARKPQAPAAPVKPAEKGTSRDCCGPSCCA
jgi:arsenite methyltransferase